MPIPIDFIDDSLGSGGGEKFEDSKTPEPVLKSDSGIYLDADDMLVDTVPPTLSKSLKFQDTPQSIPEFYFPYGKQSLVVKVHLQELEVRRRYFFNALIV